MIATYAIISRLMAFLTEEIVKEAMMAEIMKAEMLACRIAIVVETRHSATNLTATLAQSAITALMALMVLVALAEMAFHCTKTHAEPMAIPIVRLCAFPSGLVMDGVMMELFIM
jgi:hypothetical protein